MISLQYVFCLCQYKELSRNNLPILLAYISDKYLKEIPTI